MYEKPLKKLKIGEYIKSINVPISKICHAAWVSRQTVINLRDETEDNPTIQTLCRIIDALNYYRLPHQPKITLNDIIKK